MAPVDNIWIIGPPCSGKTTLARLVVARLRAEGRVGLLLDGDEIRDLDETRLGYDTASRRKQTRRVMRMARWALRQGAFPVVAINHPFEDDRAACRAAFAGYCEVWLKCEMKTLITRDRKKLYLPALKGEKRNVVGVDIPFDVPTHADLTIENDAKSPEASLAVLWETIGAQLDPALKVAAGGA